MQRLQRRVTGERGVTLVEVLVVVVLLSVIGTLVTKAVLDSHKVVRVTDDQTQGLSDVRLAAERLGRDIRDARAVLCNPTGTDPTLAAADASCQYHLQLWIDYNSDYAKQTSETVTWQLATSSRPGQYDLVRTVDGNQVVQARTIVTQVAFSYDRAPGATVPNAGETTTELVNVNMTYDAVRKYGTSDKSVAFTGRLRNVS